MSLRYFVCGGAGFIGSHLVDALVSRGRVTVYDNFSLGRREFLSHHDPGVVCVIEGDLLDADRLRRAMAGHDAVFHLAANSDIRVSGEDPSVDLHQGTVATFNVLEAMRSNGINRLVFSSSSAVYGESAPLPLREDAGPLMPISFYGASKLAGEGLISAFCNRYSMRAWVFRFGNIVGPRATHGVILDFVRKLEGDPRRLEILGDGRQSKPYLHVADCIEGMLHGLDRADDALNLFNLACSGATSVATIAEAVVEAMDLTNVEFCYTGGDRGWPGDVPQVRLDSSRMAGIGWSASITSDEAVRRAAGEIVGEVLGETG